MSMASSRTKTAFVVFGLLTFVGLAACSNQGAKNKQDSTTAGESDGKSLKADSSFKLTIPDDILSVLSSGNAGISIDDPRVKDLIGYVGKRLASQNDQLVVKCDGNESSQVRGFMHLGLQAIGGWEDDGGGRDDGTDVDPEDRDEEDYSDPEDRLDDDGGEAEDSLSLTQGVVSSRGWNKAYGWHRFPGIFVPLRCDAGFTVEMRGLRENTQYRLTGHLFDLSQKMHYQGVTEFSYPQQDAVKLVMKKVKTNSATVEVIFSDDEWDGGGLDGGVVGGPHPFEPIPNEPLPVDGEICADIYAPVTCTASFQPKIQCVKAPCNAQSMSLKLIKHASSDCIARGQYRKEIMKRGFDPNEGELTMSCKSLPLENPDTPVQKPGKKK